MSELRAIDPEDDLDLRHYSSKYYDPAKAREYYLRTRELKGRSGGGETLSKESREAQSQAKTYVREQVRTQRTAAQKAATAQQKARLEKLRKNAEATRERIVEKLKALTEKLVANIDVEVPKPKLNEIPASASPKQRAFLEKQNARMMSEYNGKLNKAKDKARKASSEANEAARAELKKVGTSLKDAVTQARTEYASARKAMTEKYSTDLKTELQNIESQVR
jgi:hypothetical protein